MVRNNHQVFFEAPNGAELFRKLPNEDTTSVSNSSGNTAPTDAVKINSCIKCIVLLRARRVKLLVTVRKVECRTSKSYLSVCLCVSENNAVRCAFTY